MKSNSFLSIAGFSGAIAVVLGAMGAHALKAKLAPEMLDSFLTGNRYHMIHSIVLLIIGLLLKNNSSKLLRRSGILIIAGTILFSFSIYILSTRSLWTSLDLTWLGPVTPIGGLLLIAGWVILGINFLKNS